MPVTVNNRRIRILNNRDEIGSGAMIYWMSRDQRVSDNWALLYAQELAMERGEELIVVFCLLPEFLGATLRQFDFMLKGLEEIELRLKKLNIKFHLRTGDPIVVLSDLSKDYKAGALITDFSPLRIKRSWIKGLNKEVKIPFFEVDAHNIVPVWITSDKQEFAARTLRPKILGLMPEFLEDFPSVKKQESKTHVDPINWKGVRSALKVDESVRPVDLIHPGEEAAKKVLAEFIKGGLKDYELDRNDATKKGISNLSPYIHFGMISAGRVALNVSSSPVPTGSKDAFLEELVVRRELSDNYCFYNSSYDSFKGFPDWAKKTLNEHRSDMRKYVYGLKEFEEALTHDPLWNAAQREMVTNGKMHGYMRMYWAKKILEWTQNPEDAQRIAIYLNDKYELDGRDPNGYVGVAWSIGGLHDRPWGERAIFGKVRYMTEAACKRKFDIKKYISMYS